MYFVGYWGLEKMYAKHLTCYEGPILLYLSFLASLKKELGF